MKSIQEKVAEFFAPRPDVNECYEALGRIFADKDKATKFLAGVAGRYVTTHTRDGVTFERESDRMKVDITKQNNVINDKHNAYEQASATNKESAMGEWNKAKDVLNKMQQRLDKQIALEEKEELIAKEAKSFPTELKIPDLSAADLLKKVSAQQAIVDTNDQLIKKAAGDKKVKAQRVQKNEIKKLNDLQAQLKAAQEKEAAPVAAATTAENNTGDGITK